jgi:hypothetical protein
MALQLELQKPVTIPLYSSSFEALTMYFVSVVHAGCLTAMPLLGQFHPHLAT